VCYSHRCIRVSTNVTCESVALSLRSHISSQTQINTPQQTATHYIALQQHPYPLHARERRLVIALAHLISDIYTHTATHSISLYCTATASLHIARARAAPYHLYTQRITLQHTTLYCNIISTHCTCESYTLLLSSCISCQTHIHTLLHIKTHCNTLQHTASRCNTLQSTATESLSTTHVGAAPYH